MDDFISEKNITVKKTARFYCSPVKGAADHVVFVLHGYRQLARFFLKKFSPVFSDRFLFVAPEGFHRFYINGYSGKVGASWMTREDRLNDIKDYINFLNSVTVKIKNEFELSSSCKWSVLGFSQGAATASRWIANCNTNVSNLILWSGIFPPDHDFTSFKNIQGLKTTILLGDSDEFLTVNEQENQLEWIKEQGIDAVIKRYQGGHDIHPDTLNWLIKTINK